MSGPASGYRLTLPEGWSRLTTGEGGTASQRRFLDGALRNRSGSDRVFAERELAPRIARVMAEAEANGALDVYVYRRELRGILVTLQFSVSVIHLGLDPEDGELLAAVRGVDGEAEFVAVGGQDRAVRGAERRVSSPGELRDAVAGLTGDDPADADAIVDDAAANGVRLRSTLVSYLVPIPGNAGSFLLVGCEISDGPLAEALTLHFDAVVSTLNWV